MSLQKPTDFDLVQGSLAYTLVLGALTSGTIGTYWSQYQKESRMSKMTVSMVLGFLIFVFLAELITSILYFESKENQKPETNILREVSLGLGVSYLILLFILGVSAASILMGLTAAGGILFLAFAMAL
jgi:hypothetical protein